MYIVEFERCQLDSIAVRVIVPAAQGFVVRIVAEKLYRDGLPDGLSLKPDMPCAVLRLPATDRE